LRICDIEIEDANDGEGGNCASILSMGVCGAEPKDAGGDENDCEELPLVICAAEFEDPDSDIKFENGINGDGGNSGGLPPLGVVEATPKVLEKMRVIDGRYLSPFVLPNSRILTELERSGGRPQPFYVVSLE